VYLTLANQSQNIWHDIKIRTDDKRMSFRDSF